MQEPFLDVKIESKDPLPVSGEISVVLYDKFFLYPSSDKYDKVENFIIPSDYAIMNGVSYKGDTLKWSRSCTQLAGELHNETCDKQYLGIAKQTVIAPVFHLSVEWFLARKLELKKNDAGFYTLTCGEFPQSYVGDELERKLEKQLKIYPSGQLYATGKKYTGGFEDKLILNPEYGLRGEKFVRTLISQRGVINQRNFGDGTPCPNGQAASNGKYRFCRVEPVVFRVKNYDNLPKTINPNGTGTDDFLELESDKGLVSGLRQCPAQSSTLGNLYQNNTHRAWLNGYNIYNELQKGNGNLEYKDCVNYDFTENNFINESGLSDFFSPESLLSPEERQRAKIEEIYSEWQDFYDWANSKYNSGQDL